MEGWTSYPAGSAGPCPSWRPDSSSGPPSCPPGRRPHRPACPRITARDLLVKAQRAQVDAAVRHRAVHGRSGCPRCRPGRRGLVLAGRGHPDPAGVRRRSRPRSGSTCSATSPRPASCTTGAPSGRGRAPRVRSPRPPCPPSRDEAGRRPRPPRHRQPLTPQQAADRALAADHPDHRRVRRAHAKVAGRPAYDLRLVPRERASLVGSVDLYVDAAHRHRAAHGRHPARQHASRPSTSGSPRCA